MNQHVRPSDPIRLILEENIGPVTVDVTQRNGGFHGTLTLSGKIEAPTGAPSPRTAGASSFSPFGASKPLQLQEPVRGRPPVLLRARARDAGRKGVFLLEIPLDARGPGLVLQSRFQAQLARYSGSRDDDYEDFNTTNQLDVALSQRSFLRLGYDYIRGHDPRGSTDRTISNHPDKYQLISPNAMYAFGAPGALTWTCP
jgi:hypothetical protein